MKIAMKSKESPVITYTTISEKGNRLINEDSLAVKNISNNFYFLVADGLGGHERGEVASRMVADKVIKCFENNSMDADFIEKTFEVCQNELLKAQQQRRAFNEMKTTMVLCTICRQTLKWGYIGDSRLYIFKGSNLVQRTLDHSVPQMLVAAHEIKEKDIRFHPDRNRLLRVMGTSWEKPEYELGAHIRITPKTSMLMCTDGFWELVDEKAMIKCLGKARTVQEWVDSMKKIVEQNGQGREMDNYSAIGIWCR